CRRDMVSQLRVPQFSQYATHVSHHIPAIVHQILVGYFNTCPVQFANQTQKREPVLGVFFSNQIFEEYLRAAGSSQSQQRGGGSAPRGIAPLQKEQLNNALDGRRREQAVEPSITTLLVFFGSSVPGNFE